MIDTLSGMRALAGACSDGVRGYKRTALLQPCSARRTIVRAHAFFWQKQKDPGPPRPNEKFSTDDLRRIKKSGPTLEDVTIQINVTNIDSEGNPQEAEHIFVPPNVLGETYNTIEKEPAWSKLDEMPCNLFLQGLRERNWTSPFYDPEASKWQLEIWKDAGRFMMPSYPGYRVVIRDADGSTRWANVDRPGLETHLSDHLAGATLGGIYKYVTPHVFSHAIALLWMSQRQAVMFECLSCSWPREPVYTGAPHEFGYNQMFEELFEAHEEKLPPRAMAAYNLSERPSVPRTKLKMNTQYEAFNPALRNLEVSYK
jgi:hypothetical protein